MCLCYTQILSMYNIGAIMNEIQKKCLEILLEIDRVCKLADIQYFIYSGTLLGAVRHAGFIPWDDDIDIVMMRSEYEKFPDACKEYLDKTKYELQTIYSDPMASNGWMKLHDSHTAFIDGGRRKGAMEGINVDIFPVDNAPDHNILLKIRSKIIDQMNFFYQYRFMAHSKNAPIRWKMFYFAISCIPPWNEMKFKISYEKYIKKYNKKSTKRVVYFSNAKYMLKVVPKECFDHSQLVTFEGYQFPAPGNWRKVLEIRYGPDYMTPPPIKERTSQHGASIIDLNRSWKEFSNTKGKSI